MNVGLHASVCDQATKDVATALRRPFKDIGMHLQGEYGGIMEHLWIDIELIESHRKGWSFRFQKRVSGGSDFGLPPVPDKFNVGHYSVKPDFQIMLSLTVEQVVPYILGLICDSTKILIEKQKKLGGFDASLFRKKFLETCQSIGYDISSDS